MESYISKLYLRKPANDTIEQFNIYSYFLPRNLTKLQDKTDLVELIIDNWFRYVNHHLNSFFTCFFSVDSYKYTLVFYITGNFNTFKDFINEDNSISKSEILKVLQLTTGQIRHLEIKFYWLGIDHNNIKFRNNLSLPWFKCKGLSLLNNSDLTLFFYFTQSKNHIIKSIKLEETKLNYYVLECEINNAELYYNTYRKTLKLLYFQYIHILNHSIPSKGVIKLTETPTIDTIIRNPAKNYKIYI